MKKRSAAGFTLIELLISISLVGVVLVIIMGAFRIGIRAWETGERDVENDVRLQAVMSLLKRQLASVCWRPVPLEEGESFIFRGEPDFLDFVSTTALVPGHDPGSVRATYRVVRGETQDKVSLEMAERNFFTGGMTEPMEMLDAGRIHVLFADVEAVRFEYLPVSTEEEPQWRETWTEADVEGLPAAIRCEVRMDEKTPPVAFIARVLSGEGQP